MKNFGNILWGIVLIIIGLIVGGNALGITNIDIFFDGWWTLFIIIPCFIGLFKEREKTGNIIILIIIGISFIFKDTFDYKLSKEIKKLNEKKVNSDEYCATFSGQNLKFDGEKFTGTNLTAVFGGIKCDLKNAIIENDVVINCSSIFGGIEIYVPDNVKVKIKSSSIFGGVDEKKKNIVENNEGYTIYINATCIFGGVDIK